MFLRKNNKIKVDFLESGKESKIGSVKSFNNSFLAIQFDGDDFETFIPFTNISLIEGIDPKRPSENMIERTQL